jgi:GH24 family phage-related lysozyme (muramidase)
VKASDHCIEFIASFEGWVDHPYRDSGGVWTIGYGHTGPGVQGMGKISRARGLQLLRQDVGSAEAAVRALGLPLAQGGFDALVSFAFNCGAGPLGPKKALGAALRKPGMAGVPAAMALYVHDARGTKLAGLVRRREAEGEMFKAAGPSGPAAWLTAHELERCRELDKLRKVATPTPTQRDRIAALVAALTEQRKRIWREAQDGGWDVRHRRQRYHSLLARTS